jgi:hypothetical protein
MFVVKHIASDVLTMNSEYTTALEALREVMNIKTPGRMVHMGTRIDIHSLITHRSLCCGKRRILVSSVFSCAYVNNNPTVLWMCSNYLTR